MVWATKNRGPLITPEIEPRLYAQMVSKAADLGVTTYGINGWTDHVHLLVSIPPKHAVMYVVAQIKGASSHFVNHVLNVGQPFAWQQGYGALTVGERQRHIPARYIEGQKAHHARDSVVPWLERVTDFDEGPPDRDQAGASVVREAGGLYMGEDIPF